MSWNRAMDEVRVERLIQKYKDNGELVSEDPALVMLKKWPTSKQYQDYSDRLPGLEQLVGIICARFHPSSGGCSCAPKTCKQKR